MWKRKGNPRHSAGFGTGSAVLKHFFYFNFSLNIVFLVNGTISYSAINVLICAPIFPILKALKKLLFLLSRGETDKHTFAIVQIKCYKKSNHRAFRVFNSDQKRSHEYILEPLVKSLREQTIENSKAKLRGTHRK